MGWGRVTVTELMSRLVGGDTERCCGKLKKGNRFLNRTLKLYRNLEEMTLPDICKCIHLAYTFVSSLIWSTITNPILGM
jgi:hypothetical protein